MKHLESLEDAIKRQIDLEDLALEETIKKYKDDLRESMEKGRLSQTSGGVALISRLIEPVVSGIKEFREEKQRGGRIASIRSIVREVDDDYALAFIAFSTLLNTIAKGETLIQTAAMQIGNHINDELVYRRVKESKPAYARTVIEQKKRQGVKDNKHLGAVFVAMFGDEVGQLDNNTRFQLGMKLIDIIIVRTGAFERIEKYKRGKSYAYLIPSTKLEEYIKSLGDKAIFMKPAYYPMVAPPKDWKGVVGGAFYGTRAGHKIRLIKTRNKNLLNKLKEYDMPKVYSAINAIQQTPWRINKDVYSVVEHLWEIGGDVAGLPTREPRPIPPKPWGNLNDEEWEEYKKNNPDIVAAWKEMARDMHNQNAIEKSKRTATGLAIYTAKKMLDEDKIWFAWTLDWRGRMYPVQNFLNPQGADLAKGLLQFAEGKPLGERGAYWLAIHGANTYGEDKVSLDERVKWVLANEELIKLTVQDPYSMLTWWSNADKPFQFLAFCYEWAGYLKEGESYVSYLPIALDGSCNGLQHFSAMLRDEIGGDAVNLIPSEKPKDIYNAVAEEAKEIFRRDLERTELLEGETREKLTLKKLAAKQLVSSIDRSLVKRNVMTVPYGVTRLGMADQIREIIKDRSNKYIRLDEQISSMAVASYIAEVNYEAIGKVVVAAREAMNWLQEVADIVSYYEVPIEWVTPSGYLVHQEYFKQKSKRVSTIFGGCPIKLTLQEDDTTKLNKRKQALGISPNFVHSLDASHLVLSVVGAKEKGISSFAMVHDSYGTHAADTDTFAQNIRDTFVDMYKEYNILAEFRKQLVEQLKTLEPDIEKILPEAPQYGHLDIDLVRDSLYFFA